MTRPGWSKLTLWLGYLITAASLAYLLRDLERHAGALPDNWVDRYASGWFGLSVLLFVCSVSCGLLIWRRLLVWEGVAIAPLPSANVYLVSQIGKYIPGNVAQHFGRVVLAQRQGVPAATTARLIVTEIVVVVAAAVSFVAAICLVEPQLRAELLAIFAARQSPVTFVMLALLAIVVILGGMAALARLAAKVREGEALRALGVARLLQLAALGLLAFVALGASFHVLLAQCLGLADPGLFACIVWITASWLISFFTPGAPAGLGVREFVLVALVATQYGQPAALEAALAFRGVSVAGDLAVLGLGLVAGLAARRPERAAP